MEQKRTLWILIAAGIFLCIVFGAAFFMTRAAGNKTEETTAISLKDSDDIWIAPYKEDEKKSDLDTSNIDEIEGENEITRPIKSGIININYENNLLEKNFEIKKKMYKIKSNDNIVPKTERKVKRLHILDNINLSENVYTKNNNNENNFKYIHISSFKPHKKYFN